MSTTRDENPVGQIHLVDYFWESSSGHVDKSRDVILSADKGTLLKMTESSDAANMYSGPRTESKETWFIETEDLIALIKKHGQRG